MTTRRHRGTRRHSRGRPLRVAQASCPPPHQKLSAESSSPDNDGSLRYHIISLVSRTYTFHLSNLPISTCRARYLHESIQEVNRPRPPRARYPPFVALNASRNVIQSVP